MSPHTSALLLRMKWMGRWVRAGLDPTRRALGAALVLAGCGGAAACPTGGSGAAWADELRAKPLLALDARRDISIKRDVRHVAVNLPADVLADAFHRVMQDPQRKYGLIRVDRLPENAGKPFRVGEKFQGRYSLEEAAKQQLRPRFDRAFAEFADQRAVRELLCRIENQNTSDFGVIARLDFGPPAGAPYVLQYRYLRGSPIAGSSTFLIMEVTDRERLAKWGAERASEIEQIFEYQEQTSAFVLFFGTSGLALHDQVVFSQARQAAELGGGRILETDIPAEYQSL